MNWFNLLQRKKQFDIKRTSTWYFVCYFPKFFFFKLLYLYFIKKFNKNKAKRAVEIMRQFHFIQFDSPAKLFLLYANVFVSGIHYNLYTCMGKHQNQTTILSGYGILSFQAEVMFPHNLLSFWFFTWGDDSSNVLFVTAPLVFTEVSAMLVLV